jgi:pimeloyl-ACP methyl ester carboxylesterase
MQQSDRRSGLPVSTGARVAWLPWLAIALGLAAAGCASTKMATLRAVPHNALADELKLNSREGPQASPRTVQFLRVYDLSDDLQRDPRKLLDCIQAIIGREPSAENVYAFAEVAYLEAIKADKKDPQLAMDLYGASVVHAYQYLFDDRFRCLRNPYDPHFRGACDLYNGALEAGLRIAIKQNGLRPGNTYTIRTASGNWDITCQICGSKWRPEELDHFEFVSDYEITGLKNRYQSYGLGVPLIAVRSANPYPGQPAAAGYYPPALSFPLTAFLRPLPASNPDGANALARHRAAIELYDPLETGDVAVGDLAVPLESDLTTPLAYFLSNPAMSNLATAGLLRPDSLLKPLPERQAPIMGLYMVQPYEPGKIPVLFVHGLWSSPMTWMEMFNDLRSCPEIRDRYQFWFYLYPTAQPFWISASRLRTDLAAVRQVLDPRRQEPALDQMVVIAHSMGGLLARLQTIDSGNDFWNLVSPQPLAMVRADPQLLQRIRDTFYFQPSPSVRRVVTIATPCRGSSVSNDATQWLFARLISLPRVLTENQEGLFHDNQNLFPADSLLHVANSIDSLAPQSPFFPVMLAAREAPWVTYHNIIGLVPKQGLFGKWAAGSDGVVTYRSAHMEDVESELIVPTDHLTVHMHPLAVLEVRRILLKHMAVLRGQELDEPNSVHPANVAPMVR